MVIVTIIVTYVSVVKPLQKTQKQLNDMIEKLEKNEGNLEERIETKKEDEITPFLDNPAVIPSAMLPAVSRLSCGTSVVVLDIPSQTSRNDWNWLVVLTLTVTVRIKITINGNMILNAMCFFITTIPPGFRFGGIFFFLLVKKGLALSC